MANVMLIDGNSLTYRAFFALPTDMATASGQVTNAVFGFTSMLASRAEGTGDPDRDRSSHSTDRSRRSVTRAIRTYKAQRREAAPDILRQQMGLVREVLDALGVMPVRRDSSAGRPTT